jgi:mRNA interferase MazF
MKENTKQFDEWNTVKKRVNSSSPRYYTVREIWWCKLGVNVGFEQDGNGEQYQRPVVIVRSFGSKVCMVVPLTTSTHKHGLRIPVGQVGDKNATAILSQIKTIDTRRLAEKISFMDKDKFAQLIENIRGLF